MLSHRVRCQVQWPTRQPRVTRKQVLLHSFAALSEISTRPLTIVGAPKGLAGIFRQVRDSRQAILKAFSHSFHANQSAHPVALLVLYLFRIAAIATYVLCGFFTDNYVVSVCLISTLSQSIIHFFP